MRSSLLLLCFFASTSSADAFTYSSPFAPQACLCQSSVHRKNNICRILNNSCPSWTTSRGSVAIAVDASSSTATENPTDLDVVIESYLSADNDAGSVEKAEAELLRVLKGYKLGIGGDDASFIKPSSQAFETVILAWLRRSNDGTVDATLAATRAQSLIDDMEVMWQPNGVLYRKLINVWCAAAMREDLDVPSPPVQEDSAQVDKDKDAEQRQADSYKRAKTAAQHALQILDRMEGLFLESGNDDLMPGVAQYKGVTNAFKMLDSSEADDIINHVKQRRDKVFSTVGLVSDETIGRKIRSHKDILDIVTKLDDKALAKRLVYRRYGRKVEVRDDGSKEVIDEGYPGVVTSTHNYNIIIDALAKSGKPWAGQQAEAILYYMVYQYSSSKNTHIKPNSITINSCLNAWAQSSSPDSAKRAEAILDKLAVWRHDGKLDLNADAKSYNTIIKAWSLSKSSDAVQNAERILERMEKDKRVKPDDVSYASVINAYAKQSTRDNHAADKAEQLLLRMYQEHKLHPEENVAPTVRCFNAALDAHANSRYRGAGRRALKLLSLMEDMHKTGNSDFLPPDVWSYNLAIKALSKGGDKKSAKQALELLDRMDKWSKEGNERIAPNTVTYNTIINCYARSRSKGSAETAEELYFRMKQLQQDGESQVKPDAVTVSSVINAWAVSDDNRSSARRAEAIFKDAKDSGIAIDTAVWNALLNCLSKSGSRHAPDRAEAILEDMETQYARGDVNAKPDVRSYTSTINALSRSRNKLAPHKAMTILARMEAIAASGDESIRPNAYTYTSAIGVWARSKDKNKAQQAQNLLNWMEEQYRRGNTSARPTEISYNLVLNACAYTAASEDTKTMEEAFKIACLTFEDLRTSDYLVPTHISYANFMEVVTKLMPEGELHDQLIGNIFQRCCRDGVVSDTVIRRLRGAGSSDLFKTLLGGKNTRNLPQAWTRNV